MRKSIEARLDSGKQVPGSQRPEYGWEENGILVARDGDVISPKEGEYWVCLSGHVTVRNQTGGYWTAHGNSRQTISGQKDGGWDAWGKSRQIVSGQRGGQWDACDKSRQTVSGQEEGVWAAWDKSQQIVSGQKGGIWSTYHEAKQQILDNKKENPDA